MSNYTYYGTRDLIALPGRSVQNFPSGLMRVERSFMCRKDAVARYRNALRVNEPMPFDDGAPAIDGLFIFPEPQEQVRDDGFVEFRVTAYGRTSFSAPFERKLTQGLYYIQANILYNPTTPAPSSPLLPIDATYPSLNESFVFRTVLPAATTSEQLLEPPFIVDAVVLAVSGPVFGKRLRNRQEVSTSLPEAVDSYLFPSLSLVLTQISTINFGAWTEWTYTWEARARVTGLITFPNPDAPTNA
jgi:hypothetical protein